MSFATLSNRRVLRLGTALVSTLVTFGYAQGAMAQSLPDLAPGGANGAQITTPTPTSMQVDIRNSNRTIDWTSFNIAAGNSVSFVSSSGPPGPVTFDLTTAYGVLNRVVDANPSTIAGSITAQDNISVWLMNPNGVTFGNGASFSGGSLVVTTLDTLSTSFDNVIGGNAFTLSGASLEGVTVASGANLTPGGDFIIVAQDIQIDGTLTAGRVAPATPKAGSVALIAARDVNFPLGVASPLSFTIGAGTTVGNLEVSATGRVTGDSLRLAAQTEQAGIANLLRADSGSILTARAANGVVTLTAATSAAGTPPASPDAQLTANGAINAGTGGITITTSNAAAANGGDIAVGGALTATGGSVTIDSQSGTVARGAVANTGSVSAGGTYTVTGSSVNLGTGAKSATGEVLVTSTVGDITGAAGLAITSNTANNSTGAADNYIDLRSAGSINLGTGSLSTTTIFQPGIGLTTGAGGTVQVGNVTGRQIGQFDAAHTTFSSYVATGDVTFGDVNLSAGFDISAAGLAVTAGNITANRVSVTAASLTAGNVDTTGTDGTTLTGALQAGNWSTQNNAVLSAGSITLNSFTGGSSDSSLIATSGNIDIDTISVAGIATINASGAISGRANANLASGTTASGSFDIDAGGTANVGGLNATGNIDIVAGDALTLGSATSSAGFVNATGTTVALGSGAAVSAADEVLIRSTAGAISGGGGGASITSNTGGGATATTNYIDLRSAGAISLAGTALTVAGQATSVGMSTPAGVNITVGNVTASSLVQFDAAHTTATPFVSNDSLTTGNLDLISGTLTLLNAGSNLVTGAFDANTINVNVGGTITSGAVTSAGLTSIVGGGLVTLGGLANSGAGATTTVRSTGAGVTITGATTSIGALTVEGEGGSLSLQAVTVNGADNQLSLRADGAGSDIGATSLTTSGGDILVNARDGVTIPSATTALTGTPTAGTIAILSGGATTSTGTLNAGEDVFVETVGMATLGTLIAGDDVFVQTTSAADIVSATARGTGPSTRRALAAPVAAGQAGAIGFAGELFGGSAIDINGGSVSVDTLSAVNNITVNAATGDIRTGNFAGSGTVGLFQSTLGTITLNALNGSVLGKAQAVYDIAGNGGAGIASYESFGAIAVTSDGDLATNALIAAGNISLNIAGQLHSRTAGTPAPVNGARLVTDAAGQGISVSGNAGTGAINLAEVVSGGNVNLSASQIAVGVVQPGSLGIISTAGTSYFGRLRSTSDLTLTFFGQPIGSTNVFATEQFSGATPISEFFVAGFGNTDVISNGGSVTGTVGLGAEFGTLSAATAIDLTAGGIVADSVVQGLNLQSARLTTTSGTLSLLSASTQGDLILTKNGAAAAAGNDLRVVSATTGQGLGGVGFDTALLDSATSVRAGSITATGGSITIIAQAGDVTGNAVGASTPLLGRTTTGNSFSTAFGAADLTAQGDPGAIVVSATAPAGPAGGVAQLGTVLAGGNVTVTGQAAAITSATSRLGDLGVIANSGTLVLGTGSAGDDLSLAKLGSIAGAGNELRFGTLTSSTIAAETLGDISLRSAGNVAGTSATAVGGQIIVRAGEAAGLITNPGTVSGLTPGSGLALAAQDTLGAFASTATASDIDLRAGGAVTLGLVQAADRIVLGSGRSGAGLSGQMSLLGNVTGSSIDIGVTNNDPLVTGGVNFGANTLSATFDIQIITGGSNGGSVSGSAIQNPTSGVRIGTVGDLNVGTISAGFLIDVDAAGSITGTGYSVNEYLVLRADGGITLATAGSTIGDVDMRALGAIDVGTITAGDDIGLTGSSVRVGTADALGTATTAVDAVLDGSLDFTIIAASDASLTASLPNGNAATRAGSVVNITSTGSFVDVDTLVRAANNVTIVAANTATIATATATAGNLSITAQNGLLELGTGSAGQLATLTKQNGDQTTANDELRVLTSLTGGTGATVTSSTDVRAAQLTATTGNLAVTATAGDVTGLATGATAPVSGRVTTGTALTTAFGAADLTAAAGNITVNVGAVNATTGGVAQLDAVSALGGNITIDAEAVAIAPTAPDQLQAGGNLSVTARSGTLVLSNAFAGGNITLTKQGVATPDGTLASVAAGDEVRFVTLDAGSTGSGNTISVTSATSVLGDSATVRGGSISVEAGKVGAAIVNAGQVGGFTAGNELSLFALADDATLNVASPLTGTVSVRAGGRIGLSAVQALDTIAVSAGGTGAGLAGQIAIAGDVESARGDISLANRNSLAASATGISFSQTLDAARDVQFLTGGSNGGGVGGTTVLAGRDVLADVVGAIGINTVDVVRNAALRSLGAASFSTITADGSIGIVAGNAALAANPLVTTPWIDIGTAEAGVDVDMRALGPQNGTTPSVRILTRVTGGDDVSLTGSSVSALLAQALGTASDTGDANLAGTVAIADPLDAGFTGTVPALTGGAARPGGQLALTAESFSLELGTGTAAGLATLTKQGGGQVLDGDEIRVLTSLTGGTAGTSAGSDSVVVRSSTDVRAAQLTATSGNVLVDATAGDVTGLATGATTPVSGRVTAGTALTGAFGAANLTATADTGTILVNVTAPNATAGGVAQLGTVTAGATITINAEAAAIDSATARVGSPGDIAVTARSGTLFVNTASAADDITLTKLGSITGAGNELRFDTLASSQDSNAAIDGNIALTSSGNVIGTSATARGGAIAIRAGDVGGTITNARNVAGNTAAGLVLSAQDNAGTYLTTSPLTSSISVRAGGSATLGALTAVDTIAVSTGGATAALAGSMRLLGAANSTRGDIVLGNRNSAAPSTTGIQFTTLAAGRDVTILTAPVSNGGGVTGASINAGRDVNVDAGSVSVGVVNAVRNIAMRANGAITGTDWDAGGSVALLAQTNGGYVTLGTVDAGSDIDVEANGVQAGATPSIDIGTALARDDIGLTASSVRVDVAQAGVAPGGNDAGDANLAALVSILDGIDPAFTGAVPASSGGTARTGGASLAISATNGNVTVNTRAEAGRDLLLDATGNVAIPNGVAGRSLGISAGGSVGAAATTLTAGEDLAIRAGTTVNAATLRAGDDLAVTAAGAISVNLANVTGLGGDATSVTFAAAAPKVSVGSSVADGNRVTITSTNAGITLGDLDVRSPSAATEAVVLVDASANGLVTIQRNLFVEGDATIRADDGVLLGDLSPRFFRTRGSFTIVADTGDVTVTGPLVLLGSDTDGTGAQPLSITATTGSIAMGTTNLLTGSAGGRQSPISLSAALGSITIGSATSQAFTALAGTGFTASGTVLAGNTTRPADGAAATVDITVTGGNIQVARVETLEAGHDLRLTASGNIAATDVVSARDVLIDAGGTLGLATATAARSIGALVGGNVGSAPLVLTAGEDIAVRSGGSVTAATVTAGDGLALTAANGVAVDSTVLTGLGEDTTSVTFASAAPRVAVAASTADSTVLSIVSAGGDIALGAVDVDSPGVASATIDASANGTVAIARDLAVEGNLAILADKGVTLGDGATPGRSYSAEGSLTILADTGDITGNGPIVLTADSDGTGAAGPLSITATTGNIALGGASLAAGTAQQSAVSLSAVQGSIALASASGAAINADARTGFTATGALNAGNTARPADGTTPTLGITVTNGNIAIANATVTGAGHDLKLAASGSVTAADLAATRDIAVGGATAGSSAASASIRSANAGRDYTVLSTGDVTLGDAAARSHVAGGAVTITSASGKVGKGAGALTLSSNTDGAGAEALTVTGRTGVELAGSTISGGTSGNRSAVSLVSATGPVTAQVVTGSTVLLDASAAGSVTATTVTGSGAVTARAKTTAALGTVEAGGALAVAAEGGNATIGTATAGGASTLSSGGTLTLGKLTSAGDVAITATTATVLQSGGTNGITATGRAVTIRTADATIGSDITAASIRVTNTGTNRMVVGDTTPALTGFVIDAAEANRLKAATMVLDAGSATSNDLAIGALGLTGNAPLTALYLNAAQRVDVKGRIELGSAVTTLQIGGATTPALATSGRARVIAIAATADAGGRIIAPAANVTLRGDSIGFGQSTGFLTTLGLVAGGTPDLNAALLMNANGASALYSPVNGGGALYTNPVLLQARSLTVRYTGFALLQNTGSPSLPTGAVLNALAGTGGPALQLFGEGTTQARSFGIFGTINGIQGSAASLLGALATPVINVDPTGARINGCLIGSGSGCVASLVAPPALGSIAPQVGNLLDTNSNFEIPFDPLVGTNNDSLFGDVGTFGLGDVDLAPIECSDPNDTTCTAPQQGETR